MLADLSIAWVFWFVLRWPLLDRQVVASASSLALVVIHLPRDLQQGMLALRAESEMASRQALREAGLAD